MIGYTAVVTKVLFAAAGISEITWRPGFNDNDWSGWLVTLGYLAAMTVVLLNARQARQNGASPGASAPWTRLALLLLLLGVNQQLDLQTLLIQSGRALANRQGWYEHRRLVQKIFFGVFALTCLALGLVAVVRGRRFFRDHRLATFGLVVLLGFVILRAASIDHVGENSLTALKEAAWKDLVELAGLVLLIAGSLRPASSSESRR